MRNTLEASEVPPNKWDECEPILKARVLARVAREIRARLDFEVATFII